MIRLEPEIIDYYNTEVTNDFGKIWNDSDGCA